MLRLIALVAGCTVFVANGRTIVMVLRKAWRHDLYRVERNARASRVYLILAPISGALIALAQPQLYDDTVSMFGGALLLAIAWTIIPTIGYHVARTHLAQLRAQDTADSADTADSENRQSPP